MMGNNSSSKNDEQSRALPTFNTRSINASQYNTFMEEHSSEHHHQTELLMPLPQLIPLNELKRQSAFIQCPYCLEYVYTKISSLDWFYCIYILAMVYLFFNDMNTQYQWPVFIVIAICVALWFLYTVHTCPSCHKKIASYNGLKRTISVTAPAIVSPSSPPPPSYT